MKKSYISRVKHKIFPWIRNWSDSMDKFRYETDVNKLSQKEWFWLHPSAYKLILYGSPIITITTMILLGLFLVSKGVTALAILPLLLIVSSAWDLIKKLKKKSLNKDTTMYDIYMREEAK